MSQRGAADAMQGSDIKHYMQPEGDLRQSDQVLKQITPVANTDGVFVVDIEKVVRDLKMVW